MRPDEDAGRRDSRDAPLSFGQEQRLAVEGTGPPRLAPFFISQCLAADEGFDRAAVCAALNEIVRRHESLRTSFQVIDAGEDPGTGEWPDGRRLQRRGRTSSEAAVDVSVIQPEGDGNVDRETAARREASRECERPFTLGESPLLRARIIQSYAHRQLLLIVASHLVADRFSLEILREELTTRYRRLRDDDVIVSASSRAQYTDFVNWQRTRAASGAWRASLTYWRKQWRRYGPSQLKIGELPFGRSGPAVNGIGPVDQQTATLDAATLRRLIACAASQAVTVHALLLAIFASVLMSVSGKRSIGLWGNFANRSAPGMNGVIGWLANPHLVGIDASSGMTIDQLVKVVRRALEGAARHEEIPLAYLWKAFATETRKVPTAFETELWVSFDSVRLRDDPALGWEQLLVAPQLSLNRFDLLAVFARHQLSLVLSYSRDRFDRAGVANVFAAVTRTIDSLLTEPGRDAAGACTVA